LIEETVRVLSVALWPVSVETVMPSRFSEFVHRCWPWLLTVKTYPSFM
jgi:hypothetical protein